MVELLRQWLASAIERWRAQIVRKFAYNLRGAEPSGPVVIEEAPETAEPEEAAPLPVETLRQQSEESGEFYFRETILDQLAYYMRCIARLRRVDPDAFDMYSQVGAHLMSRGILIDCIGRNSPVSPWFRATLPAFGAVFFGEAARTFEREKGNDQVYPRFLYFQKYAPHKAPPKVQRVARGAVYVVTVYWGGQLNPPDQWPVLVDEETGRVSLLRNRVIERVPIRHRDGEVTILQRPAWRCGQAWAECLAL